MKTRVTPTSKQKKFLMPNTKAGFTHQNFFHPPKILDKNFGATKNLGGFTVVEMLVVLAIIAIISGVVLFKYGEYTKSANLSNAISGLALTIREAQVWSTSSRKFPANTSSSDGERYNRGFGVSIDMDSPDRYIFFGDCNSDNQYISGTTCGIPEAVELISTNMLESGHTIQKICLYPNQNLAANTCQTSGKLDLAFKRPKLNPIILYNNDGGVKYGKVVIFIQSPTLSTFTKSLVVTASGNITIE